MSGVLSGFFVIAIIVLTGMLVGRLGILGDQGRYVLNRLTYFVAAPALVFVSILNSSLDVIVSANFAVAALAGLICTAIGAIISVGMLKRDAPQAVITAVSGAMVNSANMGFPIAAYVLGDVALALPVALWQMAIYTPLFQFVLHAAVSGKRPSVRAFLGNLAANPMIIASVAGVGLLLVHLHPAAFLIEPIKVMAGVSIPGMLLAFGMSLSASKPFSKEAGYRADIVSATIIKLVLMPLVAWALAVFVFHLHGTMLYAAVVLGALPTAQNVYVAAARYEVGEEMTRDTALFTSAGTMLVLLVVSALFAK